MVIDSHHKTYLGGRQAYAATIVPSCHGTCALRGRPVFFLGGDYHELGPLPVISKVSREGFTSFQMDKDFSPLIRPFSTVVEVLHARFVILGQGEKCEILEWHCRDLDASKK